jgi:ferredoxin-NADP reductase
VITTSEFTTTAEVVSRRMIASGVVELLLARQDRQTLPAWSPGAHIDLLLPDGTSRQYSLCGDVGDLRTYRIAVLEEPDGRGFSRRIHQEAVVGSTWAVRGPRSHFEFADSTQLPFHRRGNRHHATPPDGAQRPRIRCQVEAAVRRSSAGFHGVHR